MGGCSCRARQILDLSLRGAREPTLQSRNSGKGLVELLLEIVFSLCQFSSSYLETLDLLAEVFLELGRATFGVSKLRLRTLTFLLEIVVLALQFGHIVAELRDSLLVLLIGLASGLAIGVQLRA